MKGLRKETKTLSQDIRSQARDFKPRPTEYKAGVLNSLPRCSTVEDMNCIHAAQRTTEQRALVNKVMNLLFSQKTGNSLSG
jgi:hypothetical protein